MRNRNKDKYVPKPQQAPQEKEQPIIHYVAVDSEPEPEIILKPVMPQSFDFESKKWVPSSEIWERHNPSSVIAMDGKPMSQMAYDSFSDGLGGGYNNAAASYIGQSYRLIVNTPYLGQPTLVQFCQNNLLATICRKKAEKLTGKWIEFTSSSIEKEQDKKIIKRIKELEKEFERLKVQDWVCKAVEAAYKFGGCLLYPKLKGDQGDIVQGVPERSEELFIEKIAKGSIEYFQIVNPIWITGINWVSDDPLSEWFYRPEKWLVMGKVLHESRALHFVYNELPDYLKPTYQFQGLSLTQQLTYDANHYLTAKNEQIKIAQKLKFMVLENTDLRAISNNQAQNGTAPLAGRVQVAQQQIKNGDIITAAGEETLKSLQFDIGGMPDVVRQNAELMCATAEISALDLFGFTPNGFSSAGEFEKKSNEDNIRNAQKNMVHHNLQRLTDVIMMNLWGEIDEGITFKWVNLSTPDPKQEAEIRSLNANVDYGYYDRGLVSDEAVVNRLNSDPDSGYEGLEVPDLDINPQDPATLAEYNRENETA